MKINNPFMIVSAHVLGVGFELGRETSESGVATWFVSVDFAVGTWERHF